MESIGENRRLIFLTVRMSYDGERQTVLVFTGLESFFQIMH